ncbi:MAG: EamA family transporter [Solirubrobacteraceae bacterium]
MRLIIGLSLYVSANVGGLMLSGHALKGRSGLSMKDLPDLAEQPAVLAGGLLYVISFLLWLYLLSLDAVTVVYPLAIGCAYTGSILCSFLVLNESITAVKVLGLLLVGAGIVLVSIAR